MLIGIEIIENDVLVVDRVINLATKWDEVPPAVYPQLAALYLAPPDDIGDAQKTLAALTLLAYHDSPALLKLTAEELYDLLPEVDWVFDRLDLKKNLLPVLKVGEIDFFGPSDELENLRFAEWCAAETFLSNYKITGDIGELHQLAATLYRPAGDGAEFTPGDASFRGDIRQKFNDQLLKSRIRLMAQLPKELIQGIYLFYSSCRQAIVHGYAHTFPQKSGGSDKDSSGWLDIYDEMSADPRYMGKNLDEEFMHTVLFSLERSNIKLKKLKEKYDI